MPDAFCPEHGPYPAELGACPYHGAGNRPAAPMPLNAGDDMPTDLGGVGQRAAGGEDDAPTEIGRGRSRNVPRFLDADEEETDLGRMRRGGDDETEIEFSKDAGPQGLLWVKEGPRRGRVYKLKNDMVLGRKDCDLVIDDPKVSSVHAKLVYEEDHWIIVDFRSKNGTFVNGERIRSETPLKENDTIKVGDLLMVLKTME